MRCCEYTPRSHTQKKISMELMNRLNKLECYITLGRKSLPGTKHFGLLGPFVKYAEKEV